MITIYDDDIDHGMAMVYYNDSLVLIIIIIIKNL